MKNLIKTQDSTGLWHTILDDKTSYLESSGSAGILSGIMLGIDVGILNYTEFRSVLEKGITGLISRIDLEGRVTGVSAGTPISSNAEDYKKSFRRRWSPGKALVMLALKEYSKYI